MAILKEHSLAFIQSRRSVYPKEFEAGEISVGEIKDILEAARFAPTHKHTEPWRFQVFRGESKAVLAEAQVEALFEAKGQNDLTLTKSEKMKFNADKAQAVIAIIMQRDSLERLSIEDELWAVACAVQNLHLHATTMGISGFWSTGAAVNFTAIRSLLQLREKDVHMGWFYLGRYTAEKPRFKDRLSVEEIATFME